MDVQAVEMKGVEVEWCFPWGTYRPRRGRVTFEMPDNKLLLYLVPQMPNSLITVSAWDLISHRLLLPWKCDSSVLLSIQGITAWGFCWVERFPWRSMPQSWPGGPAVTEQPEQLWILWSALGSWDWQVPAREKCSGCTNSAVFLSLRCPNLPYVQVWGLPTGTNTPQQFAEICRN